MSTTKSLRPAYAFVDYTDGDIVYDGPQRNWFPFPDLQVNPGVRPFWYNTLHSAGSVGRASMSYDFNALTLHLFKELRSTNDANWIWTNEVRGGNAPLGTRAFRKTFTLLAGQFATAATIYMDADNEFTLYCTNPLNSGRHVTRYTRTEILNSVTPGIARYI
ncbi:hypothetical protein CPC08DRAFT_770510 [Agrocybe pediades]|nr:hypothetical protein CPC08DRAFT_770510 [Agrocybe pediades]